MQTHCPNCHARVQLTDDHARAKLRCAECGRVFVARADELGPTRRRARGLVLGGLAGLLALIALIFFLRAEKGAMSAADAPASAPAAAGE